MWARLPSAANWSEGVIFFPSPLRRVPLNALIPQLLRQFGCTVPGLQFQGECPALDHRQRLQNISFET
jgi:hypothetical protein